MRNILKNLDTRSGAKYEHIRFEERLKIGSRILIERERQRIFHRFNESEFEIEITFQISNSYFVLDSK